LVCPYSQAFALVGFIPPALTVVFIGNQLYFARPKLYRSQAKLLQPNEHAKACMDAVDGTKVERVQEYKYLGTVIDNKLNFNANTESIHKKMSIPSVLFAKASSS
jgi:hypothetical protein